MEPSGNQPLVYIASIDWEMRYPGMPEVMVLILNNTQHIRVELTEEESAEERTRNGQFGPYTDPLWIKKVSWAHGIRLGVAGAGI